MTQRTLRGRVAATTITRLASGARASAAQTVLDRRLTLAIAFLTLFFAWLLFNRASVERRNFVGDVAGVATALVSVVWSLQGLRQRGAKRGTAASWRSASGPNLLSLSLLSYGIGSAIWSYYELVLHRQPFPSWADASFIVGVLTLMSGILLLPSRPLPPALRIRVLLDGLMTMAALVTFSWFFLLGPTLLDTSTSLTTRVLGAGYPLADLAMLYCLLAMSAQPGETRLRRARLLLGAGMLAYIVSDVGFGLLSLRGTYETGNPIDIGWMAANLLIALGTAALRVNGEAEPESTPGTQRNPVLWRALLPYALVPGVAALLLFVWRENLRGALAAGVYVSAGVLLALILVRQVFAIVENSRLYQFLQEAYRELEALATTDGMTGLPNHRTFQERLRAEIKKTDDHSDSTARIAPLALLLIDVDRFKSYNDRFGHPAGDEALRRVARLLRHHVREGDLAARYGGEEFAVILPATDAPEALRLAEVIRAAAEAETFPHRPVTLSIGVSLRSAARESPEALIAAADQALYSAKFGGRNRVTLSSAVLERSGLELEAEPDAETAFVDLSQELRSLSGSPTGPLVPALLSLLDLRNHEVEEHCERVSRYCLRLAEEVVRRGDARIAPKEMHDLALGALLHDIGKIGVPDLILSKPGPLTEAERAVIQKHPLAGARILARFPSLAGAVPVVRSHHERWDGTGYPDRLEGDAIPLAARIFALVDTLDAMTSDRPYRAKLPHAAVVDEVRRQAGSQFDPMLVDAFLSIPEEEW